MEEETERYRRVESITQRSDGKFVVIEIDGNKIGNARLSMIDPDTGEIKYTKYKLR